MSEPELERYRIISTLGRGGMATVLLAEDLRLNRRVALKRLNPGEPPHVSDRRSSPNIALISRLRREALLGASLSHPNLVSIYDVVDAGDGGLVIVMEYVPGETLRELLEREGRLSPELALPLLEGIAAGLDAIHAQGIVHRDLKPANVLLGERGVVKLADFGIARAIDSTRITSQGMMVGTLRYMAPEQLEDAPSNPAMDIYALGVVALEMLTGERARPESHPLAIAHALATKPPPDVRNAWPDAPPAVAELLARAMDRDPARRPGRAGELVKELRAALGERGRGRGRAPYPPPVAPPPLRMAAAAPLPASTQRRPARSAASAPERAPRSRTPAPGRAAPSTARRGPSQAGRRRWAAPLALAAVLAVGIAVAALGAQGSPGSSRPAASSRRPATTATTRRRARASKAATTANTGAATTASTRAATTATTTTAASATAASASSTPAGGSSTSSAVSLIGASSPIQAVESFYHLAAAHDYSGAWALADANFRRQLEGYQSFEAGQAADRSITFNRATLTSQSATAATVAVQTTSSRTTGTESCSGTVGLIRQGAGWELNQIDINCS